MAHFPPSGVASHHPVFFSKFSTTYSLESSTMQWARGGRETLQAVGIFHRFVLILTGGCGCEGAQHSA